MSTLRAVLGSTPLRLSPRNIREQQASPKNKPGKGFATVFDSFDRCGRQIEAGGASVEFDIRRRTGSLYTFECILGKVGNRVYLECDCQLHFPSSWVGAELVVL
jgi:hypothetical protein